MKRSSRCVADPVMHGWAGALLRTLPGKVQFRDEARRQLMKKLKAGRAPDASECPEQSLCLATMVAKWHFEGTA
ncbi:hypothetical protein [Caballeronia sp. M23-90]